MRVPALGLVLVDECFQIVDELRECFLDEFVGRIRVISHHHGRANHARHGRSLRKGRRERNG